jgi:hypothetical protein
MRAGVLALSVEFLAEVAQEFGVISLAAAYDLTGIS